MTGLTRVMQAESRYKHVTVDYRHGMYDSRCARQAERAGTAAGSLAYR